MTSASQEQGQEMRLKSALCALNLCQRSVFSAYFGCDSVGWSGAGGAGGAAGVAALGWAGAGAANSFSSYEPG